MNGNNLKNLEFKKWKNQYIDLLNQYPELIAPCNNNSVPESTLRIVTNKIKDYSSIICELGSGSGMHIVEAAQRNPNSLFIGFELRYKRAFKTAEKAAKLNINNLMIIRTDSNFIDQFFKEKKIDGVYINFPDPWSKPKWKKHRIFKEELLKKVYSISNDNSWIALKTDQENYYLDSLNTSKESTLFRISENSIDLYESQFIDKNITTEFEQLFLSKKLPIFYLKISKI